MDVACGILINELSGSAQSLLYYSFQTSTRFSPTMEPSLLPKRVIIAYFPFADLVISDEWEYEAWKEITVTLAGHLDVEAGRRWPNMSKELQNECRRLDVSALEKRIFEAVCERLSLSFLNELDDPHIDDGLLKAFEKHFEWARGRNIHELCRLANAYIGAELEDAMQSSAKQIYAKLFAERLGLVDEKPCDDCPTIAGVRFGSNGILSRSNFLVWCICISSEADVDYQIDRFLGACGNDPFIDISIFLLLGDQAKLVRHIAKRMKGRHSIAVADSEIVSDFFTSSRGLSEIRQRIISTLPISVVSPYRSEGAAGDTFVGRRAEIERILTSYHSEFCILGPRKIGKTSLLGEIKAVIDKSRARDQIAVHVDAQSSKTLKNFQRAIYGSFEARTSDLLPYEEIDYDEDFFTSFTDRLLLLSTKGYRVTFLVDEIDEILKCADRDAVESFLRSTANRRLARFVVFGYTTLNRRIKNGTSAIYNLFERITLGPLDLPAAFQLINDPMTDLGVRFESPQLPKTIIDLCSSIPWLIQYMCNMLLESIHGMKQREITERIIMQVFESPEFSRTLTNTVLGDESLGVIHRLIIYVFIALGQETCTESELVRAINSQAYELPYSRIEQALQHLTETYVFRNTSTGYRFFVDQQRRVLMSSDIEQKINYLLRDLRRRGFDD